MNDPLPEKDTLARLRALMARLRDPEGGCPWDRAQTHESLAPFAVEEAYEVAEAAERGDVAALRDELGDLLFQVVFHARVAEEAGRFDLLDVAEGLIDKMIRRHPHVFAGADAEGHKARWEAIKAEERRARGEDDSSALAGVSPGLPPLLRAAKLQKRAACVGFDWDAPEPVLDKIREEVDELAEELARSPRDPDRLADEIGDLLFATVNLARHLGIDPEAALRRTNRRFEARFRHLERDLAAQGRRPQDCDLETLEAAWARAKAAEDEDPGQAP